MVVLRTEDDNKDANNQSNRPRGERVENTPAEKSRPTTQTGKSILLPVTIKEEPQAPEEQEIEAEWFGLSADQEQDALDLSNIKPEPVLVSLEVIKQEKSERAETSEVEVNTPTVVKQEREGGSMQQKQPKLTKSSRINVECSKCMLVFHNESEVLGHRCIGKSPWYCKPCNKYYKTKETLSRHKRYNCPAKGLICVTCKKTFPDKSQLACHQIIHLKIEMDRLNVSKLSTCKICHKIFVSNESLNMHERCHEMSFSTRNSNSIVAESPATHAQLPHSSTSNLADRQSLNVPKTKQHGVTALKGQSLSLTISAKAKNQYHCTVCRGVFTNRKVFMAHTRQHKLLDKINFQGHPVPFKLIKTKQQQQQQQQQGVQHTVIKMNVGETKNSSGERYACIICRKSFAKQATLIQHKKLHTPARKALDTRPFSAFATGNGTVPVSDWICKICGLDAKSTSLLWQHMREEHSRMTLKCSHCSRVFDKVGALKSHEKTHEPKIKCTACGKLYSTQKALTAHRLSIHNTSHNSHLCRKCNIRFDTRSALLIHARTHQKSLPKVKKNLMASETNKSPESYTCSICGKTFSKYESLKRHVSVHATGKHVFYPCEICGLKLVSIASYNTHVAKHFQETEKTQYPKCKQSFTSQELPNHFCVQWSYGPSTSMANSVKIFKCDLCPAVFGTQQARNSHMRVHKNWKYSTPKKEKVTSKPVQKSGMIPNTVYCPLCSKAFLSKVEVQRHMKLHHQKI